MKTAVFPTQQRTRPVFATPVSPPRSAAGLRTSVHAENPPP
ncbi:hypothetical protein ACQEU5_19440 [Marinactinospora thermotolerans]|nr:hypothetical protein [Marinactinospora thermotolerans]